MPINSETAVAIFAALRYIASRDGDHARELNGQEFNKIDGDLGHRLANSEALTLPELKKGLRLARKYRRQLPQSLRDQLHLGS